MKFKGYGSVWDSKKEKILLRFPKIDTMERKYERAEVEILNRKTRRKEIQNIVKEISETEISVSDEYVISRMIELGYKPIEEEEDIEKRIREEMKNGKRGK